MYTIMCMIFNKINKINIAGVYAGALSYADDITLVCPSVWGLRIVNDL